MLKKEKPVFVDKITKELSEASSILLVNYAGLSVKMQQDLKKKLKGADAKMIIVKNTLLKRAGKEAKIADETLEDTVLSGQTALVLGKSDPIAPLQVLYKFAKEFQIPSLKVGVIDGNFQDKMSLEKLALLPTKEILQAQALGAISAPLYGIVGVLQGNIQQLLYILKTKAGMSNS